MSKLLQNLSFNIIFKNKFYKFRNYLSKEIKHLNLNYCKENTISSGIPKMFWSTINE